MKYRILNNTPGLFSAVRLIGNGDWEHVNETTGNTAEEAEQKLRAAIELNFQPSVIKELEL